MLAGLHHGTVHLDIRSASAICPVHAVVFVYGDKRTLCEREFGLSVKLVVEIESETVGQTLETGNVAAELKVPELDEKQERLPFRPCCSERE